MFHLLFVFLSLLLTSNSYGVVAVTLNASMLNQLGYNNASTSINIYSSNIDDIDPNTFKGYTNLTSLTMQSCGFKQVDLGLFKDLTSLKILDLSFNPLTQLTNPKKISFPFLHYLILNNCPLISLDQNVINGTPNLTSFSIENDVQFYQLKTNQLSGWKNLIDLSLAIKNQTSLTKAHFNGLNRLNDLAIRYGNIKTIEVHTFFGLSSLTSLDLSGNQLTSFEYLQIPSQLNALYLQLNKLNYFLNCFALFNKIKHFF